MFSSYVEFVTLVLDINAVSKRERVANSLTYSISLRAVSSFAPHQHPSLSSYFTLFLFFGLRVNHLETGN